MDENGYMGACLFFGIEHSHETTAPRRKNRRCKDSHQALLWNETSGDFPMAGQMVNGVNEDE